MTGLLPCAVGSRVGKSPMASVEAFKPLSITGVIIIPVSGKHCIVRAAPSCSDFLVASLFWGAQESISRLLPLCEVFSG